MTPEDLDRRFAECVAARDLDGLLALYEENACYVTRDGGNIVGRRSIRPIFERLMARRSVIDIADVHAIAHGDLAVIRNKWTTRTQGNDGTMRESNGAAIEIARRQPDGRWLFAIDDPYGLSRS